MRSIYQHVRSRTYAWYVTFGDLLTLLVCFFLVLTHGVATEPDKTPYKQALTDEKLQAEFNGIGLASQEKTFKVEGALSIAVLEGELLSGMFEKRIADRFASCLGRKDAEYSSALVSLCRTFLAEDKRSTLVLQEVYEAIGVVRACIGNVVVRFDKVCSSSEMIDGDSIGSVEFVASELSHDRRV